jgi:UDP-N-acetylglucosamine 1-carboxyvinyltransferase
MGATIHITDGLIHAHADRLHGTTYTFDKNTHTGTETMLMAAVLAEGKTVLKNAALEPEVDDLINFLNHMGARIHRYHHRVIEIDGVKELTPTIYRIMPDRNEAVSYACAAVATKGDIVVENANRDHLEAFLEKLEAMGGGIETGSYGIRFFYRGRLQATDIVTKPHPGFMTDWQPLYAILLTQAEGTGIIHETIYPQRFQYIDHLKEMGVKVRLFQPEHTNPGKVYNFNLNGNEVTGLHAVAISGPTSLKPGKFVVKDLRPRYIYHQRR